MSTSLRDRQPAGAPASTGGQFKAGGRPTADLDLAATDLTEPFDDELEPDSDNQPWVHRLSVGEYELTVQKIAKLNERAAKRGFTGGLEVHGERVIKSETRDGITREYVVMETTITGQPPSYNGWTFLSRVDVVGDDFIVNMAPGGDEALVDRAELKAGWCDHCRTTRHNRAKLYLVTNDEGETKQVGSTCIKDFLGWKTNPVFISEEDANDELERGLQGARFNEQFTTETTLQTAIAVAELMGGFKPAGFGESSTRSKVSSALYGRSRADETFRMQLLEHYEAAAAKVQPMLEEIKAALDAETEPSGYTANLKAALFSSEGVSERHLGIAVSALSFYDRLKGDQVKAAEKAAAPPSNWVGTPGQKMPERQVTIRRAMTVDGFAYGTTQSMLVMVDADGNVFKAYSAAGWTYDVNEGDTVTLAGTVKAHDEYQDTKQTVLTRIKRLDTPADASQAS